MKLTETLSPEQCREAMLLLGGQIDLSGGERVVLDRIGIAIIDTGGARLGIDVEEAVDVPCIIQVAAEQVVREAGYGISVGDVSGCFFVNHKMRPSLLGMFKTYLAALLAALRAVTKERDNNAGIPAERPNNDQD